MIGMGTTTQHLAAVCGVCWLVELDFSAGLQRLTTAPLTLTAGGHTWQGLGALSDVEGVSESADGGMEEVQLGLSLVSTAMLAAALGQVEGYRGRRARLYLQLLTDAFQPVGEPVLRWAGFMDRVTVERTPAADDGDGEPSGRLLMSCSRAGLPRSRKVRGLKLTHERQQARFPGDTGLAMVRSLIESPSLWLSKKFQER